MAACPVQVEITVHVQIEIELIGFLLNLCHSLDESALVVGHCIAAVIRLCRHPCAA